VTGVALLLIRRSFWVALGLMALALLALLAASPAVRERFS
jgi:hypothetical protein